MHNDRSTSHKPSTSTTTKSFTKPTHVIMFCTYLQTLYKIIHKSTNASSDLQKPSQKHSNFLYPLVLRHKLVGVVMSPLYPLVLRLPNSIHCLTGQERRWYPNSIHCLTAASTRRCSLSTRFSAIVWHRSIRRGVTLEAPSS